MAKKDIDSETPFLLLASGEAPISYKKDEILTQKYSVYFFEYGCITPSLENMTAYNIVIFQFLESKYGDSWISKTRKDVVGLKDWKANR